MNKLIEKIELFTLKKNIIFLIIIFSLLLSCIKETNQIKKPEKVPSLPVLYRAAFSEYEKGNWSASIELFQKVETSYSYSEWSEKAILMIIYIYYEANESFKTLNYIRKYKKLYPSSKNSAYVDYIGALIFYENINTYSRDQTNTKAALEKFSTILKKYPNSIYAQESLYKLDLLNEILAGQQMNIARFYMKKSKWIAAIKRLNIVINEYGTTIFTIEALHRLVEIYYKLGNVKEAKKYASILGYNFNDSDWYKKSYKIVGNKKLNFDKIEKKKKRKLGEKILKIFKFSE